jgi:GT2 family glycosyltransferase
MIDLCIIIVSWNTKEYLLRCLESIYQKTESIPWEVVIVDNGSRDGSGTAVKKMFPAVRLIENDRNLGFSKAVNQGLKILSSRYALLLNPDTQVKERTIEQLVSFMDAHPEVGISGGQLLNGDGSKQNSIANFPSLATELLNKSFLRWMLPKRFPGKERNDPEPIEVDSVIGACLIVKREAMDQVGLLDENYFLFLEETDWCYRMKQVGWKVYHVPQAKIYHFQGKSAEKDRRRAKVEYYRSRYLFFKKNRGSLTWAILLIGLVIRLWFECLFVALACILTFFTVKKLRRKLLIDTYLIKWHLRLCPKRMGLSSILSSSLLKGDREERS